MRSLSVSARRVSTDWPVCRESTDSSSPRSRTTSSAARIRSGIGPCPLAAGRRLVQDHPGMRQHGPPPRRARCERDRAGGGYRPTPSCTDADRSLISNIHDDGIPAAQAASDAIYLVDQILTTGGSGVGALLAAHDHKHLTDH